MYRPTVRYADVYKEYIDDVFQATTLDRNQIIRLALFVAANSKEYNGILNEFKRGDVPTLPSPKWRPSQSRLWMEQEPTLIEGDDVNVIDGRKEIDSEVTSERDVRGEASRRQQPDERRTGEIHAGTIAVKNQGGIRITIG